MNTKYGKLISRERDGTLTAVYPEIIIDDEVDFANRNSTFPVTNIGIANAIDNAVDTAKNSIQYAFTSEDGGLGWNENTQRGYVDFSNIPSSKVEEIALAIVKPNSAISIDSSSGKIDVDFSKLKPSDIVPLCDSGGGIVADTTNGKLRISFKNINADGFSKLGILPVANGGTGQTTVANIQAGKDGAGNTITATYVTLATAQNITGAKTFSTKPVLNQVGLDMTVKDTNSATTRTAQVLHANSDNAGYGINLGVGGSGNTVLGAGESCTTQLNELAGNAGENLYLVSDGNIYFKPNGNTWSNAKTVTLNSAGEMSGLSKVTATEFVGNLTGNLNGDVTGTFYGPCKGNADSATKLQTARTINGTSFDGTGNITTTSWGTARNISISNSDGTNTGTAVSVNGSANATLKLPATIKASITGNVTGNCSGSSGSCTGNAKTATTLQTARKINGVSFNGSADITVADSTKVAKTGDTMSGQLKTTCSGAAYQLFSQGMTKGTAPSSVQYEYIEFMDKPGNRMGWIGSVYYTNKATRINLSARKSNAAGDTAEAAIGVNVDADGTAYGYAPTPTAGDSSTKIATTAWVASKFHFSTAAPSDSTGVNGDIWYQYV